MNNKLDKKKFFKGYVIGPEDISCSSLMCLYETIAYVDGNKCYDFITNTFLSIYSINKLEKQISQNFFLECNKFYETAGLLTDVDEQKLNDEINILKKRNSENEMIRKLQ